MKMPSPKPAFLALGAGLLLLCTSPARAADDQKPPPPQSEEQKKAEAQKKQQARENPTPAPAKAAPLRFTDDDLEAYHKRPAASPDEDEEETEEDAVAPGLPGAVPPVAVPPVAVPPAPGGAAARPPLPPGKTAPPKGPRPVTRPVVRPAGIAPLPQNDPLKPFRDREAKEKFRNEQLQRMRNRLAEIDKRLAYLNSRKVGVLDPLVGMPAPREGDDAKGESAMRPRELLEKIDVEIKGLEQEREQVQADLVSIETRFSQETQSR
jgi:hypothetical protein